MFKTKSLYVIWILLVVMTILSTALCKDEYSNTEIPQSNYIEQVNSTDSAPNLGMAVIVPTAPGTKVTVYDMFFANCQGKAIAIFLVIFSILFYTADLSSGYIKNIGGQVQKRSYLILSKTLCMTLYTILSMILFLTVQAASNAILFGYLEFGDLKTLALYFVIQTLLHIAFVLIAGGIAIVLRNNVMSMIIGICLCMNVTTIFYSVVDKLVNKAGAASFHLVNYTVTGKISMLTMNLSTHDIINAIVIAVSFSIVSVAGCNFIFNKKDIN